MDRVCWVDHKGRKMLVVSVADMSAVKSSEYLDVFKAARAIIDTQPAKSLLLITDVTRCIYNAEAVDTIKKYAAANTPFLKASAIVGASPLHAIVINTLRLLVRRDMRTFATLDAAKDYMAAV